MEEAIDYNRLPSCKNKSTYPEKSEIPTFNGTTLTSAADKSSAYLLARHCLLTTVRRGSTRCTLTFGVTRGTDNSIQQR